MCRDNCLLGLYCLPDNGVACRQGLCVECVEDSDCAGSRYTCDPTSFTCQQRVFDPNATRFGIFYHTWHCPAAHANPVHDLSEVQAGRQSYHPDHHTFYWWDQPQAGYYCLTQNDALLRQHAEQIRDAGINFVFLDVTNHAYVGAGSDDTPGMILEPLDRLLAVWSTVPNAPRVVAWVPVEQPGQDASRFTVDAIHARMQNHPEMQFIYRGKPLLLVTENPDHPVNAARVAQLAADYTVRHMWAHVPQQPFFRPELWSFMNMCQANPTSTEPCQQYSATLNGAIEQITVTTAYQMDYMSVPGAVPKHHGRTFRKQFETALNNPQAPIVTITGWNEWIVQRQPCGIASCDCATYPQGCFLDAWDVEHSRDIEPGQNAAGDFYYRLLVDCIALFRQGARCDADHANRLCCADP